jgi:pyrroloquinoline quinone biosynthesis protein D
MATALLDGDAELVRPRWARLSWCRVRERWLLLVPERVLFPCPTTVEILERLEAPHTLDALAAELACEFDAPEEVIRADIAELVTDLVEKGYVRRIDRA